MEDENMKKMELEDEADKAQAFSEKAKTDSKLAQEVSRKAQAKKHGIVVAVLVILVVGLIGFGALMMVLNFKADRHARDLEAEIAKLTAQLAENGIEVEVKVDEKAEETGKAEVPAKKRNPIISATAPLSYNLGYGSGAYGTEDGEFSLNVGVENGEVSGCNINSVKSKWVDGDVSGTVTDERFLKDCKISGITGKIYKVVNIGQGHDNGGSSVAFIMEDGSVEYLPLYDAIEKSSFSVKKLKINGFVIDAIGVGVSENDMGGYVSTIFVLADGSYVKYDSSMLNK